MAYRTNEVRARIAKQRTKDIAMTKAIVLLSVIIGLYTLMVVYGPSLVLLGVK